MSVFAALAALLTVAAHVVLAVVIVVGLAGGAWVLWDCMAGPSAQAAAAARRRARRGAR